MGDGRRQAGQINVLKTLLVMMTKTDRVCPRPGGESMEEDVRWIQRLANYRRAVVKRRRVGADRG